MTAALLLPDDVARLVSEEAAKQTGGDVAAYLTRVVLDEKVRREGSRRSLLLRRAEGIDRLQQTENWEWNEAVAGGFTVIAPWMVRTGRPVQVIIDGQPQLVVQTVPGFRAARQWFNLARHYLTNP